MRVPGAAVTSVRVRSAGRHALAARRGRAPARVIAAFERSLYIETEAGLACLGTQSLGNGPLNALCDTLPRAAAGDLVAVDLASAVLWRPAPLAPWNPATITASLGRLRRAALRTAPAEGFAFLLAPGMAGQPVLAAHAPAAEALAAWVRARAHAPDLSVPKDIDVLIGLGPGLTPSGDDLLGGALAALRAAGQGACAEALAAHVMPLAQAGTSRISRAHLACAAQGECGEAVHDMMGALLAGTPDLEAPLARVAAVGHTSGWDALAGIALAFRALSGADKS